MVQASNTRAIPRADQFSALTLSRGTCEDGFKYEHHCFTIKANATRSLFVLHLNPDTPSTSSITAYYHARPSFTVELIMMLCSNRPEGFVGIEPDVHS